MNNELLGNACRKTGRRVRAGLCLFILHCSFFVFSSPLQGKEGEGPEFVVKNGYHFGTCAGYCNAELVVEDRKVTFKKSSQPPDSRYPPVEVTRYLKPFEYNILKNLLEAAEFASAQDKYGCPDCYGQGTEWLEVTTPQVERRIEMDFNATPVPVESLLNFLRRMRAELDGNNR